MPRGEEEMARTWRGAVVIVAVLMLLASFASAQLPRFPQLPPLPPFTRLPPFPPLAQLPPLPPFAQTPPLTGFCACSRPTAGSLLPTCSVSLNLCAPNFQAQCNLPALFACTGCRCVAA